MIQTQDMSQYYDLKKVFDDANFPDEHFLIEQMENGTQLNFPDVMDGTQQSLIMLPDNSFHYGKGKDQVIIHLQLILDRIKELEDQIEVENQKNIDPSSLAEKEEKELNVLEREHMKNLADGLLTEQAEGDIHHRFHELLHDEIGFLVHGYLPETYLSVVAIFLFLDL